MLDLLISTTLQLLVPANPIYFSSLHFLHTGLPLSVLPSFALCGSDALDLLGCLVARR